MKRTILFAVLAVGAIILLSGCNATPAQVVDKLVTNYCAQDEATRVLFIRESVNAQLTNGQITVHCTGDILSEK